jgi:Tfp pilus assembly protein FimV
VPDLPPEPAAEDLPALVAALRAANARLREIIEAKDAQLAVAQAALETGSSMPTRPRPAPRAAWSTFTSPAPNT